MIEDLERNFEERSDDLIRKLSQVMRYVLRPECLTVSCTSGQEGIEAVKKEIPALKKALYTEPLPEFSGQEEEKLQVQKEGIKDALCSSVCGACGTYRQLSRSIPDLESNSEL